MNKNSYAGIVNPKNTPQSEPLMGENQVRNASGGYVYATDEWTILDRFLILGTLGGTYHASEAKLTKDAATSIISLIAKDGARVIARTLEVSDQGLAVKNSSAVFTLALAARFGETETKKAAFRALPKIARTSTDMFSFVGQYKELGGGWGSVAKAGLRNWYLEKSPEKLAYQMVKYRQRDGWTHHDALHLAHPKASDDVTNKLFAFAKATGSKTLGEFDTTGLPGVVVGYKEALTTSTEAGIVKLIEKYNLPREAVPTEFLNSPKVWEAMLPNMPATALIRNLGKMSSVGLVSPLSNAEKFIAERLANAEWLQKSRIHPISVLMAALVYKNGHGVRGSMVWNPSQRLVSGLDAAFYDTFKNVEPTGRNHLIGVDISSSMTWGNSVSGVEIPGLTARVIAAALAMTIMRTEENSHVVGFSSTLVPLAIDKSMSLQDVMTYMDRMPFGSTDCSQPMVYAKKHNLPVDAFVVITDNDTNTGRIHPSVALRDYRASTGRAAKCAVLATAHSSYSIADPKDPGMLDIVGFSADVPAVLSGFVRS